jgi:hypothetical protein
MARDMSGPDYPSFCQQSTLVLDRHVSVLHYNKKQRYEKK